MRLPSSESHLFLQQFDALGLFEVGLKSDKHSGSDEQVGQRAEDQRQRSYVLLLQLHCRPTTRGHWSLLAAATTVRLSSAFLLS